MAFVLEGERFHRRAPTPIESAAKYSGGRLFRPRAVEWGSRPELFRMAPPRSDCDLSDRQEAFV